MKKQKHKFSITSLFYNERFIRVLSVIIAIVAWLLVATFVSPETTQSISGNKIDFKIEETATGKLGLDVIDMQRDTVEVLVRGKRYVLGDLDSSDFIVSGQLSGVNSPGTYEIKLEASKKVANSEYEIISVRPSTITVKFDRIKETKVPVLVDSKGVSVADGLISQNAVPSVTELTIKGPESEVVKVKNAVVEITSSEKLSETKDLIGKVRLQDENGAIIENSKIELEKDELMVTIPVYKTKTLPVTVEFVNLPSGTTKEDIKYTLSHESINVACPPSSIDSVNELVLARINMKDYTLGYKNSFEVKLPSGFVNLENITNIELVQNDNALKEKEFTVNNFSLLNTPAGITVSVATATIYNVKLVGPADIINTITKNDIIGEIDLTDKKLSNGQWNMPVDIKIPGKGLVWAVGEYKAVVNVS